MSYTAHAYEAHPASKSEIRKVVNLMLSGSSSDPVGMAELARSWWKRLIFKGFAGPRFLQRQMDTLVVSADGGVVGFLVVQYDGDTAGAFDWAVLSPMSGEGKAVLAELIRKALALTAAKEYYSYFYFGLMPGQSGVTTGLQASGLEKLDYQLVQMTAGLPLELSNVPSHGLLLVPKVMAQYKEQMGDWIAQDYPQDYPLRDAAVTLHLSGMTTGRLYAIEQNGVAAGFVMHHSWRKEARLLYALHPDLWNSDTEVGLVGTLIRQLAQRSASVRLRTFSRTHLEASRTRLESLGLRWEDAPWERWITRTEITHDGELTASSQPA